MKLTLKPLFLVVLLLVTCSCASIVSKSKWPLENGTTPTIADVSITNKKGLEIYKGTTPTVMILKSASSPLSFKPEDKTPTKIVHHDGGAVIFVNGFRFGFSRRRDERFQNKLKKKYWNTENPGFTREVNAYFEESENHFVNGSYWKGSKAKDREASGYFKGMEMVTSGEIKLSQANGVMTIVMHSQGNAYGIGVANGIVDKAKIKGKEVKVNLVFLSVHQPGDIILSDEMKKRGIQFTYLNDNAKIVAPIGKLKDVEDANVEKREWKKSGLKAHSATVDDKNAFIAIKKVNNLQRIFTIRNEGENLGSLYYSNSRSELFIKQIVEWVLSVHGEDLEGKWNSTRYGIMLTGSL